jgi:endonuclease III
MITAADFNRARALLGDQAEEDIEWAQACKPPVNAEQFALEAIFVICNSGMKNTIARAIFERVKAAIMEGRSASEVFGHKGKAAAIDHIWRHQELLCFDYSYADDKVAFLASLPWIGEITKYHLAKNFGADVAKPDVHLVRLADREGCTPQALCERLAVELGLRVAAVDTVLWRACANGIINSRTGEFA